MRSWLAGLVILLGSLTAAAQGPSTNPVSGYCDLGGSKAQVSGLGSTNYLQGNIPGCTITVYLHGTTSLATIYADDAGTPLTNPFTAVVSTSPNAGYYIFWAAVNQGYDVVASGGVAPNTYPAPQTIKEVYLGGSGGGGTSNCPAGVLYDIQLYLSSGNCTSDTGIGQINTVTHTLTEQIASLSQQVDVSDATHSGLICQGHSTGSTVDSAFCTQPSATFSPTPTGGYGLFPPDNAPTTLNQTLRISSTTPTNVTTAYGAIPFYPTTWATAGGQVSYENLWPLWTSNCPSPATCADLISTQIPWSPSYFYGVPSSGGKFGSLANTAFNKDTSSGTVPITVTLPNVYKAGDALVFGGFTTGTYAVGTISDTCGNTWTKISGVAYWYATNIVACSSPDVITVTVTGAGNWIAGGGEVVGGGVLDAATVSGSTSCTGSGPYTATLSPSVTTTQPDVIIVLTSGGGGAGLGEQFYTPGTGFTSAVPGQLSYYAGGVGVSFSMFAEWGPAATVGVQSVTYGGNVVPASGGTWACSDNAVAFAFKPSVTNNPQDPIPQYVTYQNLVDGGTISSLASGNFWCALGGYPTVQACSIGSGLSLSATGVLSTSGGGGTVTNVSGTTNQIDVATGTTTPVISLDGQYTSQTYAACTNTADALTVTLPLAPTSLVTGLRVQCKSSAANTTTTPTLNVNGLGAHTIVKAGNSGQAALVANDILTNMVASFVYDATSTTWELQNPQQPAASGTSTICSGTITLNPGAVSSNTCSSAATGTCAGLATTDNIMVDFNADPTATTGYLPGSMGTIVKYPTANTVNVKYCNNTTGSITPSSVTLNYRVVR